MKDTKGYLFGAFCTEEWKYAKNFYGDGYSFVFTFREGDDLEIYRASGEDDHYQLADTDGFIIGGAKAITGKRSALSIFNQFTEGHSGECETYASERLCGPAHLPDLYKKSSH